MNRSGLGRGLGALLPEAGRSGADTQLNLELIRPNPYQPRREFAAEALAELADSIRVHGVLQPITVRQAPDGHGYQLVAGERRLRAAKLAGLPTIPATVRACTERELLELALIENLQREDINALEAAISYRRCLDEFGLTQEELAVRVGKSRSAVANTLRLLRLPAAVQALLADGTLSEGHARALLSLADEERQLALARRAVTEALNVREVEALARGTRAGGARKTRAERQEPASDPDVESFVARLSRRLGTKVELKPGPGAAGTLVISYYGLEDLERIAEACGA